MLHPELLQSPIREQQDEEDEDEDSPRVTGELFFTGVIHSALWAGGACGQLLRAGGHTVGAQGGSWSCSPSHHSPGQGKPTPPRLGSDRSKAAVNPLK